MQRKEASMAVGFTMCVLMIGLIAAGLFLFAGHGRHMFGTGAGSAVPTATSTPVGTPTSPGAGVSAGPSVSPAPASPSAPPTTAPTPPPPPGTSSPAAASPAPGGPVAVFRNCDNAVRLGLYPAGSPLDRACRAANGRVGL